eukprot:TRINITY_DN33675_c0_g1_i1.p1 TRINITY_DN33675_c0_g1~~TRINITY_DN33675_c0_g1_i1.p1  ORF type:complete len:469 (+),score=86.61 TRINITY_DN33675_c0_g1_i1:60-1466(+)
MAHRSCHAVALCAATHLPKWTAWLLLSCSIVALANDDAKSPSGVPQVISTVLEHHHVLPYYIKAVEDGTLRKDNRAVVLHMDSHADMAVPNGYEIDDGWPQWPRQSEDGVGIADFLVRAVHMGIVGHLIFVAPPWERQLRDNFESGETFTVVVGLVKGELKCDVRSTDGKQPREKGDFAHIFHDYYYDVLESYEAMRDTKEFKVTLVALEHLPTVAAHIDPTAPLIVDIDEDVFSTESPGSIEVRASVDISDDDMTAFWHLVTTKPLFDKEYFTRLDPDLMMNATPPSVSAQVAATFSLDWKDESEPVLDKKIAAAVEHVCEGFSFKARRKRLLKQIMSRAKIKDSEEVDTTELSESMARWVDQPYFFADETLMAMFVDMTAKAFAAFKQTPTIIHLVRSPEFTPPALQPVIECHLLRVIEKQYPGAKLVQHDERIEMGKCDGVTLEGQLIDLRKPTEATPRTSRSEL